MVLPPVTGHATGDAESTAYGGPTISPTSRVVTSDAARFDQPPTTTRRWWRASCATAARERGAGTAPRTGGQLATILPSPCTLPLPLPLSPRGWSTITASDSVPRIPRTAAAAEPRTVGDASAALPVGEVEPPRMKSADEVGAATPTPQCPQRASRSAAAPLPTGARGDLSGDAIVKMCNANQTVSRIRIQCGTVLKVNSPGKRWW